MRSRSHEKVQLFHENEELLKFRQPKRHDDRSRWLTREEAAALLERTKPWPEVYRMTLFSLHTGGGFREIHNLTWGDINLENEIIRLLGKGKKSRIAYITPQVRRALEEIAEERKKVGEINPAADRLFRLSKGRLNELWQKAVSRARLNEGLTDTRDKVVFQTLRHTFGSWLALAGTPIFTIRKLMGEADPGLTLRDAYFCPALAKVYVMLVFDK